MLLTIFIAILFSDLSRPIKKATIVVYINKAKVINTFVPILFINRVEAMRGNITSVIHINMGTITRIKYSLKEKNSSCLFA